MLPPAVRSKSVRSVRRGLDRALRKPALRKIAQRMIDELERALHDPEDSGIYGGAYFGNDRDPYDRMGLSGYERYDRDTSNANAAALMIWRHFPVKKTLDVGCATGFVVEALSELSFDARGTDISHYAIEHPAQGAAGLLEWGDLMAGLPYKDGEFELLTCLEVLEHMLPEMIPTVVREIARVAQKYVVCTIPSFGPNQFGPGGWYNTKVLDERVAEYEAKGPNYRGPIPRPDLYLDAKGEPIEGHLTISSFEWWTEQFASVGLIRCGNTELEIHPQLAKYGLTKYWNLYVFRKADVEEPRGDLRSAEEIAHWEENFKLNDREAKPDDAAAVAEALARNGAVNPSDMVWLTGPDFVGWRASNS